MATSIFAAFDGLISELPGLVRLVIWAVLAGAVSMALYRLASPQASLQGIKQRRVEIARRLRDFDGPGSEAFPLLRAQLRLAFEQLLRVLWPTALAALPVIAVILWLDMAYGYDYPPPGAPVAVATDPPGAAVSLERVTPHGTAADPAGTAERWMVKIEDSAWRHWITLSQPVPALYKPQWWNALIDNPAGYLPGEVPVELISIDLPYREYLSVGPGWLRTWHVAFFVALFATSLGIKLGFRII